MQEAQRKQILSELVSDEPEMRLLYTTPESLRNPTLRDYLKVGVGAVSHAQVYRHLEQQPTCTFRLSM